MDSEEFLSRVRADNETALSRLGSSKSLYAFTDGEMNADAVFGVVADVSHAGASAFEAYRADAMAEPALDAYAAAGDRTSDAAIAFGKRVGDDYEQSQHAAVSALGDYGDGTGASEVERLGATLGYLLVAGKLAEQATGFFTGEADPSTASDLRAYRGDLEDVREEVLDALPAVVADDDADDAGAAADAAASVIQGAYEEYASRLEAMGVNPKPVC
jgi:hypothetical protein